MSCSRLNPTGKYRAVLVAQSDFGGLDVALKQDLIVRQKFRPIKEMPTGNSLLAQLGAVVCVCMCMGVKFFLQCVGTLWYSL